MYGLLSLNTEDVFNSVNGLINGMSLAFITSLSGMILSHIIYYRIKDNLNNDEAQTFGDVVGAIKGWMENWNDNLGGIQSMMYNLQNSITGEEEGTLTDNFNEISFRR